MKQILITVRSTTSHPSNSYLMTIPNTDEGDALFKEISALYREEGKRVRRRPRGKRKAAFIKQATTNPQSWEFKMYNKYIVNGQWVGGGHPWNFNYNPKLKDRENCTRFDVYFA